VIYVASSWRNELQPRVVQDLRERGLVVYDFRNPSEGDCGFAWSQLEDKPGWRQDGSWQKWTPTQFREALKHPRAREGFATDRCALEKASSTLLVMPCGRSAHLELGFAIGKGQRTAVFIPPGTKFEPELMWSFSEILVTWEEVHRWATTG